MLPTDARVDWPYINKTPQYGTMDDLSTADLLQLEKLILNTFLLVKRALGLEFKKKKRLI